MTNKILVSLSLIFLGNFSFAQSFNLASSDFKIGDLYVPDPKIFFDLADWTIRPESYSQLDSIAAFLKKHNHLIVEIGVHTDSRVSDEYGMRLDHKRAESTLEYLMSKGVDSDQVVAKGYGKSELIISDKEISGLHDAKEKEYAHSVNRRTEFKIIEITK